MGLHQPDIKSLMKPLRIYVRIPWVANNGVGFYRMYQPLKYAEQMGEVEVVFQSFTFEEGQETYPTEQELAMYGQWADILYFARNDVPDYLAIAGGLKEAYKKKLVFDFDDNVQATRPYNPGYRSFHPNSANMMWNIKSCGVMDAMTASTNNLKEYYTRYQPNIYVCPNGIDYTERDKNFKKSYRGSKLFKKKEGEIRIGWSGSSSHWENLQRAEKAVLDILRKYPQTTFYFTGLFGGLFNDPKLIAEGRIRTVGFANLKQYGSLLKESNYDIAIAPLADNMFNRAKSNLRILEYASCKYPVIASDVEPYRCFTNKEVKLVTEYEDWYAALEELVLNKSKREELSNNLYKRCKKEFDISVTYKYWIKAFRSILK